MNTLILSEFIDGYVGEALAKVHDEDGKRVTYQLGAHQIENDALEVMRNDCERFFSAHENILNADVARFNGVSFYKARNKRGQAFITYDYNNFRTLYDSARTYGNSKLILARNGKLRLSP